MRIQSLGQDPLNYRIYQIRAATSLIKRPLSAQKLSLGSTPGDAFSITPKGAHFDT